MRTGRQADGQGINDEIARREAAIGTKICADCGGPAKPDEALCLICREPRRSRLPETNPYKRVWNTVEDEEAQILTSVRNNALFVPTPAILAERHRSTARYLRKRATSLGAVVGRTALKEAIIQDHLADSMDAYDVHINLLKRPTVFTFTVRRDEHDRLTDRTRSRSSPPH